MKEIAITKTRKETERFASRFSRQILKLKPTKRAIIVGLIGELGSGKTVFAKGFAKGLGIKEIITSPTFVLEKIYKLPSNKNFQHFVHIDTYRLKPKELTALGFQDLVYNPLNIVLIEWAERIKNILPKIASK